MMTQQDNDNLAALEAFHECKRQDYTVAVPNRHLAKRHGDMLAALRKAREILKGTVPSCGGCVRETASRTADEKCAGCVRNVTASDHYVRRKNA